MAPKRWLPRSMASRIYLIIFIGLMLAQGLSFAVMFYERYESATTTMLDTVEHEVGTSVAMLDRLPAAERADWLILLRRDNYFFLLGQGQPGMPLATERSRQLVQRIEREVGPGYRVQGDTISMHPERYQVHFTLHDGSALTLEVTPRGVAPIAQWLPIVLVLQLCLLLACTWLAVRLAAHPLAQLAQAAEAMTPTADGPRMSEAGPVEVAKAAIAFNTMQERIARHLKERLHILASISHDLQTPITRMRLRAESLDEGEERPKILRDLHEMEHLVREGVAYARSAHGGAETPVRMDVKAFLESLVFDYQDIGKPVAMADSVKGTSMVRQQALRRVLGNLIDNAIKYGGSAEVSSWRNDEGALCMAVCDRGPGIPDDQLEQVLQPFYRLEGSRNRDTGGAGLGLAIAAQLARAIGGDLRLSNQSGGGLAAVITLP
ncbi:sensor histidine kinase [Dyella mobilis]|uniref:histidine kinase n=2 Tax=Dyella mobilis TaxID=1849582 RepID=A0ABS2KG88_9GAMM|nr:HAMP domain-containing sensor histidine kinase [Dyella mobilis]MBM7129949.1 HAMP domain-containing histidine kinase [Dyella mobilis]GLQ97788.1 two-component sensor histidine kinase [Dyella mobilis]